MQPNNVYFTLFDALIVFDNFDNSQIINLLIAKFELCFVNMMIDWCILNCLLDDKIASYTDTGNVAPCQLIYFIINIAANLKASSLNN